MFIYEVDTKELFVLAVRLLIEFKIVLGWIGELVRYEHGKIAR